MSENYQDTRTTVNFITKAMKNYSCEATAKGKTIAKVKLKKGNFQGDSVSLLLFIIAMMPLNYIVRKCIGGYQFTKLQ